MKSGAIARVQPVAGIEIREHSLPPLEKRLPFTHPVRPLGQEAEFTRRYPAQRGLDPLLFIDRSQPAL